MPNIGHKDQFVPLVESGTKRQTIRATRNRPFKKGDRLYHWSNFRSVMQRKILENDCISADPIIIDNKGDVYVKGRRLSQSEREKLAYSDGFRPLGQAWSGMKKYFSKSLPFTGQVIKW